jgi:tetratricopeptide (TPR) repeat protein
VIAHALGHHAEAEGLFQRSLELRRSTDDRAGEAAALFNLGLVAGERGAPDQARDRLHRCRDIIEGAGTGQLSYLGYALTALGEVEIERGDLDRAGAALSDALALRRRLRQPHLTMETRAGLVQLALCLGDRATARLHAESIHCFLPGTLDGTVRPVRIYLACHAAFASVGDPRAAAVLEQGHAFLLERAARIGDQNERRSFLENVPSHRRLLGERRKARANFGDGAVDASLAAGGL